MAVVDSIVDKNVTESVLPVKLKVALAEVVLVAMVHSMVIRNVSGDGKGSAGGCCG